MRKWSRPYTIELADVADPRATADSTPGSRREH